MDIHCEEDGMKKVKQTVILAVILAASGAVFSVKAQGSAPASDKKPAAVTTTPANSSNTPKASTRPKSADDPALAGYTIGEQDVLDIDVWQEKELSGPAVVRPDGKITLPLVGEIYVVGMTPVQLQTELMKKLEPFVTVPQVTVAVHEINSRKVYVMGQVAHEGVFHINATTTVSQILVQSGGLKDYAKRTKIYVLRNMDGKQVRLPFNYNAFIKGQKKGQDFSLRPGDTIVVP
jgi:polysaccharide biosynthesis/export protein